MQRYYSAVLVGSANLEFSVAAEEILPRGKAVQDFCIYVDTECHISINNGDYVYMRGGQLFNIVTGHVDSCRIKEDGVTYNWCGTFCGKVEV